GNKQVTKRVTEQVTNVLSSSSNINIIKNTTTKTAREKVEKLSAEWQTIDHTVLAEIGFNNSHLLQLYKMANLDPIVVQDSIYHFAFDLKHNDKKTAIKGDILNYFMGIVS